MENVLRCRSCQKPVSPSDIVCGNCGAPSPAATYNATKLIIGAAALLLMVGIVATFWHRDTKTSPFTVGRTYLIAKPKRICLTVEGLANAEQRDVVTNDQATQLGCMIIDPGKLSRLKVVDKSAALLKVRVVAPELRANNFEGWTDIENIDLNSVSLD